MIPEDWDFVLLDSVAKRGSGHTPKKGNSDYWNGSIYWVSLQDSAALDRVYISETAVRITQMGVDNSSAHIHPADTVVLSRDAGVGKSAIIASEMAVSQHFITWTCGPKLHNLFLYYFLQSQKTEFERIAIGSTIKTIGLPFFKAYKIPLPCYNEQRAIAESLRDADARISALEALIAKKRDLKQAAMQQLLTGKTRLPGFSGEWAVKPFGRVAAIRNQKTETFENEAAEFCVELEQIGQNTGQITGYSDARNRQSVKYQFQKGDVLFGRLRPYLRKFWWANREGVCSTEIWPIIPTEDGLTPGFLFQTVQTDAFIAAADSSYGTHMPRTDWKALKLFELPVPNDPKEQSAIAEILSDMDEEIAALEAEAEKARAIKRGMMQTLLTGKVRLV